VIRTRITILNMNKIQTYLQRIYETGLTDEEIGERIEAPQSIVTRLRNGVHKSTNYERGQKIYALARKLKVIQKAA